MDCYLCKGNEFSTREGKVRDLPSVKMMECVSCGLVFLDSHEHILEGFYEEGGMHNESPTSIEEWLKKTDFDDQRRFDMLKPMMTSKRLLDFGCGAGGFLLKSQTCAKEVAGVELEERVRRHWGSSLNLYPEIGCLEGRYDLITAFHVIEHLKDPIAILKALRTKLHKHGRIVLEVPNSDEALLTFYKCSAFQNFTYWSKHLYLFNVKTIERIARIAGLKLAAIKQHQRYPLSNHLYWLSNGEPGGHEKWAFLDCSALDQSYAGALASIGKCDTIIAYLEIAE